MYKCNICGYVYHEKSEGANFSELSENYRCPICNAKKDKFLESD